MGLLLVLAINMRMDCEYGVKALACVENRLRIKKRFDYPAKLFSVFEENQSIVARGALLNRLFPMGLIGLAVASAGMFLALSVNAWWVVSVALFSVVTFFITTQSYITLKPLEKS